MFHEAVLLLGKSILQRRQVYLTQKIVEKVRGNGNRDIFLSIYLYITIILTHTQSNHTQEQWSR